ncbi:HPP family protein [Robertmurraya beringensis]|uniref:HPP family protein n=1 Tax=Robertmurraya beringensis TaxID=641660 RepID=A0ABV6KT93_9BACI|nr:HPP family protein [Mycobacteroides abscessus subsp. abscessus]
MNTLQKSNDNIKNPSLERLNVYFNKMKGEARKESKFDYLDSIISVVGVFLAVTIICILAFSSNYSMVIGPLGASSILVFAAHNGPLSQPRQVIGGYILSTVTGILIWSIFGKSLFIIIITLVIVLILMALTKTIHPPAAASALVAINFETGWGYLIPVLLGIFLLVFVSMLYNNLFPKRQYPKYWL